MVSSLFFNKQALPLDLGSVRRLSLSNVCCYLVRCKTRCMSFVTPPSAEDLRYVSRSSLCKRGPAASMAAPLTLVRNPGRS